MFYTPAQIPCYECPERCLIRSYDGRFLSSNGRGGVFTRTKARSDELWIIIKVGKNSLHTLFQSYTTGRYLCCQQESSKLRTCKSLDGATAWTVGFPDQKERVTISCFMDQYLCLVNNRLVCGSGTPYGWHLEIQTGELCFLYSPLYSQRIRCRPGGAVQLTSSPGAWYGWEVWRFVESGIQGQVYLTSWTHSSKVLKTDEDGIVTTTDDRHEPGTKWRVVPDHSSMMDHDGVILKSSYDNVLCTNGQQLVCKPQDELELSFEWDYVWHLYAAHRQRFYIKANRRFISISSELPSAVRSTSITEQWEVMVDSDENLMFRNVETGHFLGSSWDGTVHLVMSPSDDEKWMRSHNNVFTSVKHQRHLTSVGNFLMTQPEPMPWQVIPAMPNSLSRSQQVQLVVAGSAAVAAAVATPFCVAAVMTAGAAAEAGGVILAMKGVEGAVAATSAWSLVGSSAALSSGIVMGIGTTALIKERHARVAAAKGTSGSNSNMDPTDKLGCMYRPFSAWQKWSN